MPKRDRGEFENSMEFDVDSWTPSPDNVPIKRPEEVACFSRNADRTILYGSRSKLAKYQEPLLGSNLKRGIDKYVEKRADDTEPSGVEPVVRALRKSGFNIVEGATIVTYRNNLNKIAGTPYNFRDAWEIDSTCVIENGPTFLDVRKLDDGRGEDARQKEFMYMGYYFENLCTGAADQIVDANEEFCSILNLQLGDQKILLAAEIDCEENGKYKELKTMREPRNQRDENNLFRHRMMKYWIQSYLAGVPEVVVGMRDDSGILRHVEIFDTFSMPQLAQEKLPSFQKVWHSKTILNFLHSVLSRIRNVSQRHLGKTIRIRYEPNEKMIFMRVLDESDFCDRMKVEISSSTTEAD